MQSKAHIRHIHDAKQRSDKMLLIAEQNTQPTGTHPVCRANLTFTHTVQLRSEDFVWLRNAKVSCVQAPLHYVYGACECGESELCAVTCASVTPWTSSAGNSAKALCNVRTGQLKVVTAWRYVACRHTSVMLTSSRTGA